MPYIMKNVVPWGRTLDEYRKMFALSDTELKGHIAGFGDGVASFNAECGTLGGHVTSVDPVYRFTGELLEKVLAEAKRRLIGETAKERKKDSTAIARDIDELERRHMTAVQLFMDDYEEGKKEGRYRDCELPFRLPFPDDTFDLGLSSHFLLLYTRHGINFHLQSIGEMLRTCREIRIFPVVDVHGEKTGLARKVVEHFVRDYDLAFCKTAYHSADGHNDMLVIRRKSEMSPKTRH